METTLTHLDERLDPATFAQPHFTHTPSDSLWVTIDTGYNGMGIWAQFAAIIHLPDNDGLLASLSPLQNYSYLNVRAP